MFPERYAFALSIYNTIIQVKYKWKEKEKFALIQKSETNTAGNRFLKNLCEKDKGKKIHKCTVSIFINKYFLFIEAHLPLQSTSYTDLGQLSSLH